MDEEELDRLKRLFEPDLKRLAKLRGKLLELGIINDQDGKSTEQKKEGEAEPEYELAFKT